MCGHASAYTRKLAMTLPMLRITDCRTERISEGCYKLTAVIRNSGYLPTYLTSQAKLVKKAPPLSVELTAVKGEFQMVCCSHSGDIGHLEGRFGRDAEWSRDRMEWRPTERKAEWIFRTDCQESELELVLTVSSPRCGKVTRHITV